MIFASELKAILSQKEVVKKLDYQAVWDYLTYQYVPAPRTGFVGIKKLPAGHFLIVVKGKLTIKKYWDLNYIEKLKLDENEWTERILQKLDEAVRLRLVGDVSLGAFLSGGVDSSAIVASMALQSSKPIKTFSIGFDKKSHNETNFARIVAKRYKTKHNEFIVKPKALELLPALVKAYEEPFGDSSAIATYYVSQMARKHVIVALNGDGGDENFAGYGWYQAIAIAKIFDQLPKLIKTKLFLPGAKLLDYYLKNTFSRRGVRFAQSLIEPLGIRYVSYLQYFSDQEKEKLMTPLFKRRVINKQSRALQADFFTQAKANNIIDKALYADIHTYLVDDLLVKVDIDTMLHSLEGRSPLLDHHFMEMSAKIPSSLKIKNTEKKYIFKKALESRLPHEIIYRKKMGFAVPIEDWFRGPLQSFIKDRLLGGELVKQGLINKKAVADLIQLHQNTKTNYSQRLWALLTLNEWLEIYQPAL